jgi:hypothetical protein
VVHEDPGVLGFELVDERLARGDGPHLVVPRHLGGVEVDGVPELALVDQCDREEVPDLAPQDRPGTVLLNVHICWVTPGATSRVVWVASTVIACSWPPGAGASAGSKGFQPGVASALKSISFPAGVTVEAVDAPSWPVVTSPDWASCPGLLSSLATARAAVDLLHAFLHSSFGEIHGPGRGPDDPPGSAMRPRFSKARCPRGAIS